MKKFPASPVGNEKNRAEAYMMKNSIMILATAVTLLATGCFYEEPLIKEHTIPINQELLGLWDWGSEPGEPSVDEHMLILKYSETEYLIHTFGRGPDIQDIYYRAYPIELGGVSCLQLEIIGGIMENSPLIPGTDNPSEENDGNLGPFLVMKLEPKDGCLEGNVLNDKVVSYKLTTTEALQKAFLENIDNAKLFDNPSRLYRATALRKQGDFHLEVETEIHDDALTAISCANPVLPEIAVITVEGGIRIYDFNGQVTQTLEMGNQIISAISYSPDGTLLVGTKAGDLLSWVFASNDWKTVAQQVADTIGRVTWLDGDIVWGRLTNTKMPICIYAFTLADSRKRTIQNIGYSRETVGAK
jgi:hypothetical protein